MNHSFNTEIAKLYGVEGAVIIENLYFWLAKNKANKKHFYDGEYWTYNSVNAFKELFPYWTERQIERILKNLEKDGAIITGNYNKLNYDRTKWYALTQTVKCIYANGEMDLHESLNGFTEMVKPIPYINTDIKTNINETIYTEIFNHYLSKENLIKHTKFTDDMKKGIDKAIKIHDLDLEYIKRIINRHSEKVFRDKDKTEYKTKARPLADLFGQKIKDSPSLICSIYLDEYYQEQSKPKEVKPKNNFKAEEFKSEWI